MIVSGHTPFAGAFTMSLPTFRSLPSDQQGRVGFILLWLIGVPIPILFLLYLLRGCT
jgi:hypothetical protein